MEKKKPNFKGWRKEKKEMMYQALRDYRGEVAKPHGAEDLGAA